MKKEIITVGVGISIGWIIGDLIKGTYPNGIVPVVLLSLAMIVHIFHVDKPTLA